MLERLLLESLLLVISAGKHCKLNAIEPDFCDVAFAIEIYCGILRI